MKIKIIALLAFVLTIGLYSCKNDDDDDIVTVPIRDRAEQQAEDDEAIIDYLKTHVYNAEDFEQGSEVFGINDLIFTEIEEGGDIPTGTKLLFGAVEKLSTTFADTHYDYYILRLRQGEGDFSPNFPDEVRVFYEGFLLDDQVFDSSTFVPAYFDLLDIVNGGGVFGWSKAIPEFNVASGFSENEDGTITFDNSGLGVMFLPSGISYFSNSLTGIPAYSPLIFKFELLQAFEKDHDSDMVPTYLEDYNTEDGIFTVNSSTDVHDGDDTDGNGIPDYFDSDDDGDGVLTKYEDIDEDGDPTNDIGKNGIPKYLDPEETESNQD